MIKDHHRLLQAIQCLSPARLVESSSVPKNKRESTSSDKESFQENVVMMTDEDIEEFAAWILEKEERDYIPPKGKER